jgi:GT2 family glycosyltransferase
MKQGVEMTQNPVVSFCIVSYNTRDLLGSCLSSLIENEPRTRYEIIIVDNHSSDGSVEMVRDLYPKIQLEVLDSHVGYTRAMNRALKKARGEFLVQLNPDTIIKPGAWDALIDFMNIHPEVGICTPKVLNRDGTLQRQCRRSAAGPWDTFCYISGLSRIFPHNRHLTGYLMTYMDEDVIHPCEAVSGSCMFMRRAVINQIGYLDEAYYAYQEDSDYCFRARQAGYQIYYVPTGQIIHYGGQGGSLINARKSIYEWHRSYWIYYRKHFAPRKLFLINWLVYVGIALRLVLKLGLSLFRRQEYIGSRKP